MKKQKITRSFLVALFLFSGIFAGAKKVWAGPCSPRGVESGLCQLVRNWLADEMNMRKEMADMPASERTGVERPEDEFEMRPDDSEPKKELSSDEADEPSQASPVVGTYRRFQ